MELSISFDLRRATIGDRVETALAGVDAEVSALSPGGAPLVLADPVKSAVSIVIPTDQLDGMASNDDIRCPFVDAFRVGHEVAIERVSNLEGTVTHQLELDHVGGARHHSGALSALVLGVVLGPVFALELTESVLSDSRLIRQAIIRYDTLVSEVDHRLGEHAAIAASVEDVACDEIFR